MKWRYGMIRVVHESVNSDFCELVEVYYKEGASTPMCFCKARIHSLNELEMAYTSAKRDGIITFFANNGVFSRDQDDNFWSWKANTVWADDDEEELYKIYGGD